MSEFNKAWDSDALKKYCVFMTKNFNIRIDQVTPNVYYKTFVNKNTYKRVKMKNFIYKDLCTYSINGELITFDRSKSEDIRSEVNFVLKQIKNTL